MYQVQAGLGSATSQLFLLLGSSVAVRYRRAWRSHSARPPERPSGFAFPDGDERVRNRQVQHRVELSGVGRPADLGQSRSCGSTRLHVRVGFFCPVLEPRLFDRRSAACSPTRADRLDLVATRARTGDCPATTGCPMRPATDRRSGRAPRPSHAAPSLPLARGRQAPGKSGSGTKKPGRPHGGVGLAGRPSPVRAPIMAWAAASPTAAPASRATAGIPLTEALYCAR